MKKKTLWAAGIVILSLVVIVGIVWYIEVHERENDPDWQTAEEIYKVENAPKKWMGTTMSVHFRGHSFHLY